MKKGFLKKAVSLGLVVAMMAALSACGKDKGDTNGGGTGGGDSNSLAKQYVYSYEYLPFEEEGDSINVQSMLYSGDRIYTMINIYNGGGAMEGGAVMRGGGVVSMSADTVPIEESEDGEAQEGVSQPRNIYKVLSFKTDGTDMKSVELQLEESSQDSWINNAQVGVDGTVYAVYEAYKEDLTDPDNPVTENIMNLMCWNPDGTLKWEQPLGSLGAEGEYIYVSKLFPKEDGTIQMLVTGEKTRLVALDANGAVTGETPLEDQAFEYSGSMFLKEDGSLLMTSYNEDWTKMYAVTYDMATNTLGEKIELPGNIYQYNLLPGTTTDFLMTDGSGVYTYNVGDEGPTQIMSYVNSDFAANYLQNVVIIDEEHFVAAFPEGDNYETKLAMFTKVDPKDIPDKEILVMGMLYMNSDIRDHVIKFNKSNNKYRIAIKDYSIYSTMEDYNAGTTKLNNDIVSGGMPDILITGGDIPVENYIAKGLLADVGSLIEKDEELSQVEFMENVFNAYKVNDKLYTIVPGFYVGTVIGKSSVLGDIKGWNMEELQAFMDQMPEGTSSFGEITREGFLYQIMEYCGRDFVDASTGKCNFDNQEFINLLEFAKTLPEEINYDEDYNWQDYQLQYRDGRTLLMYTSIYQMANMNYTINGMFGEPVTFVGFPNENRNGSVVNATIGMVLSSKSKNLDGAWEFARYYLTDEYQKDLDWGMPVQKKAFLEQAQKATERPFYLDENGEKVEYDETFWLNDAEITLPPMTQEQVDEIVSFIESVDRTSYYNENIRNIINEEAAAFFAGQKGAAEVVQIIQSRAQIYVDENR